MIASYQQAEHLAWLQIMLLKNWVAQVENHLSLFLSAKQPYCLLALENERAIALVIAQPCNRKGTCWSLSIPDLLDSPKANTLHTVKLRLLQAAIEHLKSRSQSWIIRCPISDSDQLSLARELGFQPLKLYKGWVKSNKIKDSIRNIPNEETDPEMTWQNINRNNAQIIFSFYPSKNILQVLVQRLLQHFICLD